MRETGRGTALTVLIRSAAAVCAWLPPRLAATLGRLGGLVTWLVRPGMRRQLTANLAHVDPKAPQRLARRGMLAAGARAADLLWALDRPDDAARGMRVDDDGRVAAALALGRGVILASPHCGGFEILAIGARRLVQAPLLAISDETRIAAALEPFRRRAGIDTISPLEPIHRCVRHLESGGALVLIADLHRPGMRGHRVRLLDAAADLPAGPALIARLADAPILPFVAVPDGGPRRWRALVEAPIPPPAPREELAATQALADAFTRFLRAYPEQWDAVDPIPWLDGVP
jgi:KDO2-lipid IV(A) lauroyltransferase